MRVLWIKSGKLLPVDTGGKIRSYNLLRFLARDHEVTLLSYYGGRRDPGYEAALVKELPGSEVLYTAAPDSNAFDRGLDYLYRLPRRAPYAVSKFTDPKVRARVADWLSSGRFDVAVCDFLSASSNFPERPPIPCVLFQHNVESSLWQRLAAVESNPLRKLPYTIESAKMTRYERATLGKFDHIIAVSEHDRRQMLEMNPACEITVVPTGVDTGKFSIAPPSSTEPPRVVFTGSMDWEPNIDAVEYFCSQIWPPIRAEFPAAIFQIVGRNPFAKVQRLASPSVEVTGTVPSVAQYLEKASVVVVPLRIGGGTRLKIFEAMAMGKALVSTSIGAEGLAVENGRDLLLADDAPSFADAVILLLRDATMRRKIEQAAVRLAVQYDWSQVVKQFAQVLSNLVLRQPASGNSTGVRASGADPVRL
ncbi:MAG: glycosyltransferase family 4 protein [Terriglobales bacterium]